MRPFSSFIRRGGRSVTVATGKLVRTVWPSAPIGLAGPGDPAEARRRDEEALGRLGGRACEVGDRDLAALNRLLPWAAMTVDPLGRRVGAPWSGSKRNRIEPLVDRRLARLDRTWPLAGRTVLEVGCFEGIHTLGCLSLGADVVGVDGRIENVVKTLARLWLYGRSAEIVLWNLEEAPPPSVPEEWDLLHHIGVLYHLTNPVEHLELVLPRTRHAVLLDTHVARDPFAANASYDVGGIEYRYRHYREKLIDVSPFAGLRDHAKWLLVEDLVAILERHGFASTQIAQDRAERNGRRVLVYAFRAPGLSVP